MGKSLHLERSYEASPEQVAAMLLDPEFRTAVCLAQEVSSHAVALETEGEVTTLVIDQVQAVRGVPSIIAKIAGESTTLRQTETWTSPTEAEVEITIEGQPGEITGLNQLLADGAGTTQIIDWEVEVRIPLVGKKVADMVVGLMNDALDVEYEVGQEWLAR